MNLEPFAQILEAANIGVANDQIFTDHMPAEIPTGVLLRLPLEGVKIDHYMPGFYKTRLQAIVRAQRHTTGQAIADKVLKALTLRQRTDFEDMLLMQMLPDHLPITYPRSDGNGIEWSLNFCLAYAAKGISQF